MPVQITTFERLLLDKLACATAIDLPRRRYAVTLEIELSGLEHDALERLTEADGLTVDRFARNALVAAVEALPAGGSAVSRKEGTA